MNENKKEYKEICEFQFIFWENKRKYIRYRYPVLKEVIWQTKKKKNREYWKNNWNENSLSRLMAISCDTIIITS